MLIGGEYKKWMIIFLLVLVFFNKSLFVVEKIFNFYEILVWNNDSNACFYSLLANVLVMATRWEMFAICDTND